MCLAEVIKTLEAVGLAKTVDGIHPLNLGTSQDQKYILTEKNHKRYVFRLATIKIYPRRKQEFELISGFYRQGIRCLKPLSCGKAPNENYCYTIFKYIHGRSGSQILPTLPAETRFQIGVASGAELRKMHQLKAPDSEPDWYLKRSKLFREDVEAFRKLRLGFENEGLVYDFIKDHLDLMKGRPITFQHNDYGAGNLIISNRQFRAVIDFNGFDWGDPVCDFFQVPWVNLRFGTSFVKGQILGYWDGKVPKDFWALYNLYIMMILYHRLVLTHQNDPGKYASRLRKANRIVQECNLRKNTAPVWFTSEVPAPSPSSKKLKGAK